MPVKPNGFVLANPDLSLGSATAKLKADRSHRDAPLTSDDCEVIGSGARVTLVTRRAGADRSDAGKTSFS
jgi:hypothetical protein